MIENSRAKTEWRKADKREKKFYHQLLIYFSFPRKMGAVIRNFDVC